MTQGLAVTWCPTRGHGTIQGGRCRRARRRRGRREFGMRAYSSMLCPMRQASVDAPVRELPRRRALWPAVASDGCVAERIDAAVAPRRPPAPLPPAVARAAGRPQSSRAVELPMACAANRANGGHAGARASLTHGDGSLAHGDSTLAEELFDLSYRDLVAVEDRRSQRGLHARLTEHLLEVRRAARAARCNHRDGDGLPHRARQWQVVPLVLPVVVDAVEEDLASAQRLDSARHLNHVESGAGATSLHRALVPAQRLARGPAQPAVGCRRVVAQRVALRRRLVRYPAAARVN
mmetsp:Transcript_30922/g.81989  ORF Transcript_30922/g.81989 Transcript_30922/m.81989 type:complete len:292 (-) Transcript_30922:528-1403(-)